MATLAERLATSLLSPFCTQPYFELKNPPVLRFDDSCHRGENLTQPGIVKRSFRELFELCVYERSSPASVER